MACKTEHIFYPGFKEKFGSLQRMIKEGFCERYRLGLVLKSKGGYLYVLELGKFGVFKQNFKSTNLSVFSKG